MIETPTVLWSEEWKGFRLFVIKLRGNFRSVVIESWDKTELMCKSCYVTKEEAQRRCWGIVLLACEINAAHARARINMIKEEKKETDNDKG